MSIHIQNNFDRVIELWRRMTAPSQKGAQETPQEYMTKAILVIMGVLVTFLALPVVIIVSTQRIVGLDTVLATAFCGVVAWSGWWLAQKGHWYPGSCLPPLVFFLAGVQRMYAAGPGTAGILLFIIAILLAAMLPGGVVHWIVLVLSIGAMGIVGQMHVDGRLIWSSPLDDFTAWLIMGAILFLAITVSIDFFRNQLQNSLTKVKDYAAELEQHKANLEQQVAERVAELEASIKEREALHQQVLDAQRETIRELATPIIPVLDRVLVMPMIGSIDTTRAQDIMRAVLKSISQYKAHTIILDITGVPLVDTGIAQHINKTVQAARLKGARIIITGISNAVAESIVDMGLDWSNIETHHDLQSGMQVVIKGKNAR